MFRWEWRIINLLEVKYALKYAELRWSDVMVDRNSHTKCRSGRPDSGWLTCSLQAFGPGTPPRLCKSPLERQLFRMWLPRCKDTHIWEWIVIALELHCETLVLLSCGHTAIPPTGRSQHKHHYHSVAHDGTVYHTVAPNHPNVAGIWLREHL